MCKNCRERYDTNVLRILDCKDEACADMIAGAPSALGSLCPECAEHFSGVRTGLEAAHIAYEIDERLVRGLDYYSRTVFEIKSSFLGAQSTISAGGSTTTLSGSWAARTRRRPVSPSEWRGSPPSLKRRQAGRKRIITGPRLFI